MERDALLEAVSERTGADEEGALEATRAVLTTLGERLSEDQGLDLAAQLPGDLGEYLAGGDAGRRFSEAEFVSRVDQRVGADGLDGEDVAPSVIGVVLKAVDEGERAAVVDQLDHYGFEDLLAETDADVDVRDRSPR